MLSGPSAIANGAVRLGAYARGSGTPVISSARLPWRVELEPQDAGGDPLRLLFSGDVGPQEKALQTPPESPAGVDYLFCESTYGDVERPPISAADRCSRLASHIHDALNDEAPLLIPAFAVERTQELLVDLVLLMQSGHVPTAPIYIDSPLATRATEVFIRNARDLDRDVDVARDAALTSAALHRDRG